MNPGSLATQIRHFSSMQSPWIALVLLALSTGCAEGNTLEGSLGGFYDTSFDSVRARLYSSELAIEYTRSNGQVPVRVILRYDGDPPTRGTYDLVRSGDVTGRTGDDDIPPLLGGELVFDALGATDGASVRGSFDAIFATGDDTSGLRGSFDTTLEVVPAVGGVTRDDWPPGQSCDAPIDATERGTYRGTLYPTISDELATSCAASGSPDQILVFDQAEEGRLTINFTFDPNVSATLYSGGCGLDGEVVTCIRAGADRFREDQPAGVYYLALEGDGDWEVTIEAP